MNSALKHYFLNLFLNFYVKKKKNYSTFALIGSNKQYTHAKMVITQPFPVVNELEHDKMYPSTQNTFLYINATMIMTSTLLWIELVAIDMPLSQIRLKYAIQTLCLMLVPFPNSFFFFHSFDSDYCNRDDISVGSR